MSFKTTSLLPGQTIPFSEATPLSFSCGNLTSPITIQLNITGQSVAMPIILSTTSPIYNFPVIQGQFIDSFSLHHASKNGTVSVLYYLNQTTTQSKPSSKVADQAPAEPTKRKQPTPSPIDQDDAPKVEKKAKVDEKVDKIVKLDEKVDKIVKPDEKPTEKAPEKKKATTDGPKVHEVMKLPNGLQYQDQVLGKGSPVTKGTTVSIRYQGMFTNGTVFDSNMPKGQLLTFTLGTGEVVAGMEQGIVGMALHGKRRIIIPSQLGYGKAGAPPTIPPNSTLVFDVELFKAIGGRR